MPKPQRNRNKKRHAGSNRSGALKKPAGRVILLPEGGDMSNRVRRELKVLKETIAEHRGIVEKQLSKSGPFPSRALVTSAAKYYPTLKKLAEK